MTIQKQCLRACLFALLATICLADPTYASISASISAVPSEVIFYTKSSTLQKSTTITWDANNESDDPYEVYYTINGASETLFASGEDGTKVADFIKQNNTYEFCLWGGGHEKS